MSRSEPSVTIRRRSDAAGTRTDPEDAEGAVKGRTWFADAVPAAARRSPWQGGSKIGMG